jgi:hypothetical protein
MSKAIKPEKWWVEYQPEFGFVNNFCFGNPRVEKSSISPNGEWVRVELRPIPIKKRPQK